MSEYDFKQIRWLAIYGAMIAHQVIDRQNRSHGSPPDKEIMERFAEEAEAVADLHDETVYDETEKRWLSKICKAEQERMKRTRP